MIIDDKLLNTISKEARQSERLRMNHNLHTSPDSSSQRLLNALEPGTKLAIHRHRQTAETYIVLRGSLRVMFYDDQSQITSEFILSPAEKKFGLDIPAGQWHSLEVLESGTVIFECKDGPYTPLAPQDIMP